MKSTPTRIYLGDLEIWRLSENGDPLLGLVPMASAQAAFAVGDRVTLNRHANVRSTSNTSGGLIGVNLKGFWGTITEGPVSGPSGTAWFKVSFDRGKWNGWVLNDNFNRLENNAETRRTPSYFSKGNTVSLFRNANVRSTTVLDSGKGNLLKVMPKDTTATITDGPQKDSYNIIWYKLKFNDDAKTEGWVVSDNYFEYAPSPVTGGSAVAAGCGQSNAVSNGKTIRVSSGGNIASAIRSAKPGDTVLVGCGTYSGNIIIDNSGTSNGWITVRAETIGCAKINSNSYGFLIRGNYIRIEGFEVYGSKQAGIIGQGVHHIEIANNVSRNNGGAGIYFSKSEFLLIDGNVTHGNAADAVTSGISVHISQNVSGDKTTPGYRVVIQNNVSYNNLTVNAGHTDGNGIILDDFLLRNRDTKGMYSADLVKYRFPSLISNNLVYNNGGTGITVYATDNVTVTGNTSYHNNNDLKNDGTWRGALMNMSASNNVWANNIGVANTSVNQYNKGFALVQFNDLPNTNVTLKNNITFNGKVGDDSILLKGGYTLTGNQFGVNPMLDTDLLPKSGSPALSLPAGYRTTCVTS